MRNRIKSALAEAFTITPGEWMLLVLTIIVAALNAGAQ